MAPYFSDPNLAPTSVSGPELSQSIQNASQGFLDIPGFSIRRKIGAGGMGIVYEALRLAENDAVAIKTIIPGKGTPKQAIDLFQREMQVLAALQHPHIVRFLGGGEFGGQIGSTTFVACKITTFKVSSHDRKRSARVSFGLGADVSCVRSRFDVYCCQEPACRAV